MNNNIKKLRLILKMSQEEFGNRIGITRSAVSKLENNDRNITRQLSKIICNEFNVKEEWLLNGEGDIFNPISKGETASEIVGRLLSNEDPFIQNIFIALGELTPEEWRVIKKFVDKIKGN